MTTTRNTPLVLIIRDGWGQNPHPEHDSFNAVKLAKTPVADALSRDWPTTLIHTSGEDVGLPEGTMGNSEVGHQNIGAGRIVDQDSVRITKAVRTGDFYSNPALVSAVTKAKAAGGAVHLFCLASDAGVHALLAHLYGCVELCKRHGMERVALHLFTDGRDTGPNTGARYIEDIESRLRSVGVGRVVSLVGRYFAMDRDNRWERVQKAYDLLTGRDAAAGNPPPHFASASDAIRDAYAHPISATQNGDEFVTPRTVGSDPASTRVRPGDSVIFVNYRGDRPRELTRAFVLPEFDGHQKPSPDSGRKGFDRGERIALSAYVCMTGYEQALAPYVSVAFEKPPKMPDVAGEYISSLGLTQFRCAETEKFPHVTFFFNDYRDEPFPGESRGIVQSPKVATYDLKPEMSALEVRDTVLARLRASDGEPVIIVNFANGDMVGHTGNLQAAIKACETVDQCVGEIMNETLARGGSLIIAADHGNAEQMWDPESNAPHTAHTTYDVPLHVVGAAFKGRKLRVGGRLADILPTALDMMGLEKPAAMTGESLLA
ncbi:MAG: 2,3-bisphosphoglycerate-independent phosphoglycerate mutase [Phycisphaerales bacterium]|jgi:2,3-bisphosphoglycerate-independent phosphoglycerate mutase|nr:2,3-bisphosphoglycerate-independent phosphoglycerate mutase [Phycisphaerales bacterium]